MSSFAKGECPVCTEVFCGYKAVMTIHAFGTLERHLEINSYFVTMFIDTKENAKLPAKSTDVFRFFKFLYKLS